MKVIWSLSILFLQINLLLKLQKYEVKEQNIFNSYLSIVPVENKMDFE